MDEGCQPFQLFMCQVANLSCACDIMAKEKVIQEVKKTTPADIVNGSVSVFYTSVGIIHPPSKLLIAAYRIGGATYTPIFHIFSLLSAIDPSC